MLLRNQVLDNGRLEFVFCLFFPLGLHACQFNNFLSFIKEHCSFKQHFMQNL